MFDVLSLPEDHGPRTAAQQSKLQDIFDSSYAITTTAQRQSAEQLIAKIGTIDWQSEGYKNPDRQRDLSIKFHWGHHHRFDDDLKVTGRMRDRHVALMAEFLEGFCLDASHFDGKEILDIGCWTGGTSLMLKALGAGPITAMEEVRKYAEVAQTLAQDIYGLDDVRCLPQSLYQLDSGSFDHIYIPGVVYHLSDPVLALRILFNRLRDGGDILIESAGIEGDGTMCWFKGNDRHFGDPNGQMSRGGWAWFWPTAACLGAWLHEAGFEDIRVFWEPEKKRVFGHAKRHQYREITRAGLARPDIE